MGLANEVCLHHVSQDSPDIKRLAKFYQELFGFEVVESTKYKPAVLWPKLPEVTKTRNAALSNSADSLASDPTHHLRGFHICFAVSNFDSFRQTLKEKEIKTHERTLCNGKVNHVYFSDPDQNESIKIISIYVNSLVNKHYILSLNCAH